ncbi:MAG: restriction endonuclease subunit S, partial [Vicinamibacterales bacterium]
SALLGDHGPYLLGLGSIARNGGFKISNLKRYGGHSDAKIQLGPGDIYVSLKDVTQSADLLGAVARVPPSIESGRLTQDTVKLVFKERNAPMDYIYWLLRTPEYREYCRAHATGTTNLGLSRDDFFAFPTPTFTPSRALIVDVLQALDDKIDLNRQMNETLEAIAQEIFKDWFLDFGPTWAKMKGREPYLAPQMWALFPDRLDKEEKPLGWEPVTLSAVSDLNSESWSAQNHPVDLEYVDLANTKWGAVEATEVHSWDAAPSRARRVLRSGDTIVGTVRPGNGSYALIDQNGLTGSTGFAVLRPKTPTYRELIYCAVTATNNIERLSHLADGAAYPAVRPDVVADTPIILAPSAALNAFSTTCAPLLDRCETNKRENRILAATRDYLLPKLMSGEIRVKDAEKLAEAAL